MTLVCFGSWSAPFFFLTWSWTLVEFNLGSNSLVAHLCNSFQPLIWPSESYSWWVVCMLWYGCYISDLFCFLVFLSLILRFTLQLSQCMSPTAVVFLGQPAWCLSLGQPVQYEVVSNISNSCIGYAQAKLQNVLNFCHRELS